MKLCSRCRQRRDGADVQLSHQTEAGWLCWRCLKALAARHDRDDRAFGPCCLNDMKPAQGQRSMSIMCNCPYQKGASVCGGECDTVSVGHCEGRSLGSSHTFTESVSHGFIRGCTVPHSEKGFTDGDGI